jgi:YVTN family beta-propeller protein
LTCRASVYVVNLGSHPVLVIDTLGNRVTATLAAWTSGATE